jgi:type II secretory pathway component PulF
MAAIIVSWMLLLAIAVAAALAAWLRVVRMRTHAVVQTLALIVGQNIPLAGALRASARHERRRLREVFERLANCLEAGDRLSTALRTAHGTCPGHILGAIQGAELGGTLPSVLRALVADLQRERKAIRRFSPAVAYFLVLSIVIPSIVLFLAVFLLPQFSTIFADFGLPPHPLHKSLISTAGILVDYSPLFILALLMLALLIAESVIGRTFFPRVPDRAAALATCADTFTWHLPLLRRIAETRALARQLPILQAAVRAGHDLAPAVRQAACVDANVHARRRLRRWAARIEAGGDPRVEARALRLPAPLRSALSRARGPDELAAALDYLCAYYRSLLTHWEQLLVSAAIPVMVLTWAACVAYVALALIVPLYALVDSMIASVF